MFQRLGIYLQLTVNSNPLKESLDSIIELIKHVFFFFNSLDFGEPVILEISRKWAQAHT